MVLGISVNPAQVLVGSLPQRFLADALDLLYRPEEVLDVLGSRQRGKVSANHDTIEAVVGKAN